MNTGLVSEFSEVHPFNGDTVSIRISKRYTVITVGRRDYFFFRESGKYDGHCTEYAECESAPVLPQTVKVQA